MIHLYPGFEKLGQSWSKPVLTTIDGTKVLIFGGGYDPAQDSKNSRSNDSKGNAVYIVNADTGALIWSASSSGSGQIAAQMNYAIPSDLRVIDSDANGSADRIYFGDLGGQLWRVDLDETGLSGSSGATVTRLADFNDGSSSGNRKFFYPPAVALMRKNGDEYLAVAIGSGNRAHPLSVAVDDRMYVYRDIDVEKGAPASYVSAATESDLYDTTSNLIVEGTTAQQNDAKAELQSKDGWFIKLASGQKNLSGAIAFDRDLMFTTYQPFDRYH